MKYLILLLLAQLSTASAEVVFQQPSTSECTNMLARASDRLTIYSGNYNAVLTCRFQKYLSKLFSDSKITLIPESVSAYQTQDILFPKTFGISGVPSGKGLEHDDYHCLNAFAVHFSALEDGVTKNFLVRTAYPESFLKHVASSEGWGSKVNSGLDVIEPTERSMRTLNWHDAGFENEAASNTWYRLQILNADSFEPIFNDKVLPALSR